MFISHDHSNIRLNGCHACRRAGCPRCAESDEASTLHLDCFRLFTRHCNAMDRLWIATAWRYPWPHAPDLYFKDIATPLDVAAAQDLGLGLLTRLPRELVALVQKHSADSPLWRYCAARSLARQLSVTVSDQLVSIPLRDLDSWQRLAIPEHVEHSQRCRMRLTIDASGIRRIENLVGNFTYRAPRPSHEAFAFPTEDQLKLATIHFKVLEIPLTMS
jgi:hypothetical protein